MPATEQTWRDQKLLHRVFAATGFALLFATMWMFYSDHDREWKHYQDTAREMDLTYNEWLQLQYRTDEAVRAHEQLADSLAGVRASDVPAELIAEFQRIADGDERTKSRLAKAGLESLQRELTEAVAKVASVQAAGSSGADAEKSSDAKTEAKTASPSSGELAAAQAEAGRLRQKLLDALGDVILEVKFRETNKLDERKGKSGELDAAKANVDLAVRDNLPTLSDLQAIVEGLKAQLDGLTAEYQALADQRKQLQSIVRQMTAAEDEAVRAAEANRAELKNLQAAFGERSMNYFTSDFPFLGKKWLTLPILDAFNSPRKIENLWSDDLTINYNFRNVRRFDRCTTCHQAMEKSAPGRPEEQLFVEKRTLRMRLTTPSADEVRAAREEYAQLKEPGVDEDRWLLQKLYGFRLASAGLEKADDVTVSLVNPGSLAATALVEGSEPTKAPGERLRRALMESPDEATEAGAGAKESPGLALGDVIQSVDGNLTDSPDKVRRHLIASAEFGKPLELVVRRGFSHPYSSHPRLDLFVGSLSPHKVSTFACTVCHEGQGSSTSFKWASHAPDSVDQRQDWAKEHGWFDNVHWIYPMASQRFLESSCLKCHHEVVELEPSERFPEPPAPKLLHGYDLIRKYGCYGCHEVNGFDGPDKRLGPDMRSEPNFFAAALQLKALLKSGDGEAWKKLSPEEQGWVVQVGDRVDGDAARHRLVEMLSDDAKAETPRFSDDVHKLAGSLKDVETPGALRKAGPSLRYSAHKLDDQFAYDWIKAPKHFRPSSRMPQFFGFRNHLADDKSRHLAEDFEPVEILGMLTYLRERSQEFEYLPREQVQEPAVEGDAALQTARIERGKSLFETRGCLACHEHGDFPDVKGYRLSGEIVQGPDLTGLGSKFDPQRNPRGADWLYSWIKQPTRYHARTVMPDLFLDPITNRDAEGKVVSVTDPAADIVAYLLSSTNPDWKPTTAPEAAQGENLDRLLRENLEEAFFKETAQKYAQNGIPAELRKELKGPERELIVDGAQGDKPLGERQKLLYIGAKSISKYGCYGCHDIPGFEDAKPIGTGLADWGRKDPAKLAFEHITHYLEHHGSEHGAGHGGAAHGESGHGEPEHGDAGHAASEHGDAHGAAEPREETPEFYRDHLASKHREGFIWQKLTEPRSYDFMKTENKRYNEWLRMPKFPFSAEEREAVMTFVLGLVAEPPANKYVYKPDPRSTALIEGRKVLEKFNCGGCHLMEPERWKIAVAEGEIGVQPQPNLYPFLSPHFTTDEIEKSLKKDNRGLLTAVLTGMPAIDDADARPKVNDVEGDALDESAEYDPASVVYPFDLWKPTVLEGRVYQAGVVPVNVPASRIDRRYPADGGVLARYLLPSVTQAEKQINPAAKGSESWAWVPPPLVGQGKKVQSQWLHDFLLNPYPIRPAVVLRMPKFNMTSAEATALAKYFAAVDNVPYPMEPIDRRLSSYVAAKEADYRKNAPEGEAGRNRFDDALRIVVNQNYCVKCHLVGDFEPKGADRAKAPNLARIHDRLRPGYLREWIANPKQVLPYTSMPVNVAYDPNDPKFNGGVDQKLYHGTSLEQVDGLVDLLMNFDNYSKSRNLIAPLIPMDAPAAKPDAPATESEAAQTEAAPSGAAEAATGDAGAAAAEGS